MLVVAALIERGGKLLVCQRRHGSALEFFWEFPGGKVAAGESLTQALERELREELNVRATIGREVYRTRHHYTELAEPLELVFFTAKLWTESVENRVFEQIEWRAPETLGALNFLAADRELIEKLVNDQLLLNDSRPAKHARE